MHQERILVQIVFMWPGQDCIQDCKSVWYGLFSILQRAIGETENRVLLGLYFFYHYWLAWRHELVLGTEQNICLYGYRLAESVFDRNNNVNLPNDSFIHPKFTQPTLQSPVDHWPTSWQSFPHSTLSPHRTQTSPGLIFMIHSIDILVYW